ncbi:FAD-dependent oxidoreductase [Silvibacterium dinghuense]|uniref:Cyclic nucleotide-binding domain-containing protein n=1 Tax=Silvibacterium dinghuense TaxID=1560006 RepID=A0A4Q1SAY7_9BACT|nr:cyclic nucleotide-binding domain-containing thioredoxin-disulfide reductase [Silvibacterium dinghuense]RXS94286.1 cyclic nucleotide-binding domain-containing protein [Silvibacterium dinghuense]GGH17194.1 hypothetical protein GCM10011586_39560 [Silvibacterium dinghuense]
MITSKILKQHDLFSDLPSEALSRFARKAADIRLRRGEWLAREGERLFFFIILRGSLELTKEIEGREIHISDYNAGEFFGEANALFGIPALSSLRAKTSCRVAAFGSQQLQELIQSQTACGKIILQSLQDGLAGGPRHAMGLPTVRVHVAGRSNDSALQRPLAFLKSNRIAYEVIEGGASDATLAVVPPGISIDGVPLEQPWSERKIAEAYGLDTRPHRTHYDTIIIGGGPAGLAAAVYGASEGLKVLLVEQWAMGGQAGTSSRIENYLGFPSGISGEDLAGRAVRQAKQFGAELVLTRWVMSVERKSDSTFELMLDGEELVFSKTVILATGVHWRGLEVDGVESLRGKGVFHGAASVEPSTFSGKRLFIIGGGNSAGQAAMSLANYAQTVTLLVRGETLATSMSQYLIAQLHGKSNIRIETNTSILSVSGKNALRSICTTSNGKITQARKIDALFIMIGADAETGWLPLELQRNEDGFICTGRNISSSSTWDEQRSPFLLETNLPGLFCAGDVRNGSIKRVSSAVGEGSMAITFVHQFLALEREAECRSAH